MATTKDKGLRIRHSAGSTTIGVKGGATVKEVASLIEQSISISVKDQCWKVGFPPKPHSKLSPSNLLLENIDLIHVSKAATAEDATIEFAAEKKRAEAAAAEEEEKKSADSADSNSPKTTSTTGISSSTLLTPVTDDSNIETPGPIDPEGYVVRRVIDADNSCLFNSIGYALSNNTNTTARRNKNNAQYLRQMVATVVLQDPNTFHEAFLSRPPKEYADWIQKPDSWGGQIELSILSQLFRTEIAALDIIRNRHDVYGLDENYNRRILVMYDGIHYDALAFCLDPSLPEEMDVTQFAPTDYRAVMDRAAAVCAEQHRAKQFTDTSNFTLRCLVCQEGLQGQTDATEHAKKTGHTNFSEYRS